MDLYIPNPLRCFSCQKFGHHKDRCRLGKVLCPKCGKEHSEAICTEETSCINCKGPHPAFSKECPVWLKEKKIVKIKTEQNITYPEARRLVEEATVDGSKSYAQVVSTSKASASSTASQTSAPPKRLVSVQTQTDLKHSDIPSTLPTNKLTKATVHNPKKTPAKVKASLNEKPKPLSFKMKNRFKSLEDLNGDESEAMDYDHSQTHSSPVKSRPTSPSTSRSTSPSKSRSISSKPR